MSHTRLSLNLALQESRVFKFPETDWNSVCQRLEGGVLSWVYRVSCLQDEKDSEDGWCSCLHNKNVLNTNEL